MVSLNTAEQNFPKVGVVLLNWNGGVFTIPCIESLLASTVPPWKIIVVDNASTDRSPENIADCFPQVDLIINENNLGFTGGNNIGIKKLLSVCADYIWILNNDTVVDQHCLVSLVDEMEQYKDIAAATGKIYVQTPHNVFYFGGAIWNQWTFNGHHRGALLIDSGQYDMPEDIPVMDGCCMFIRASVINTVGPFDPRFYAYHEDLEWSLRVRKRGFRLRYVPSSMLWHKVAGAARNVKMNQPITTDNLFIYPYLSPRNRTLLIRLHATGILRKSIALILLFYEAIITTCRHLVRGRWWHIAYHWHGLYDGIMMRLNHFL